MSSGATNPRALGTNPRSRGRSPRQTDPLATMDLTADELREIANESYALYRRTKHWRKVRRAAVKRAGGRCEGCDTPSRRLDVHHLTYERIGREADEDLQALCRQCHEARHAGYTAEGGWLRDTNGNIVGRVVEIVVDFFDGGETFRKGGLSSLGKNELDYDNEEGESEGEEQSPVQLVWDCYVAWMEPLRREIDPGARQVIRDALKVATAEECCRAIAGCAHSPFHMGKNDRKKKYNKLSQILKGKRGGKTTREQIDMFLETAPQIAHPTPGDLAFTSSQSAIVREAKLNVLRAYDLAGSAEAKRKGDESEKYLAEQGIRVVRESGARPVFVGPEV